MPARTTLGAIAVLALAACSRPPELTDAIEDGDNAVEVALQRSSAGLDAPGDEGKTALHLAAMRGDTRVVQALLARGPKLELRDAQARTPLYLAASTNHAECVYMLLRAGADPNAPSGATAATPLHAAARYSAPEVTSILLHGGANPNARDSWGETPLHVAAKIDWERAADIASLLLAHGADPDARDVRGFTPLHTGAAYDNVGIVRFYDDLHADLSTTSTTGSTPLDVAMARNHVRAADLLFRLGGKPATTPSFEPPLHRAARVDDLDEVRLLSTFGTDPSLVFNGQTPLEVARANGSEAVASFLARSR